MNVAHVFFSFPPKNFIKKIFIPKDSQDNTKIYSAHLDAKIVNIFP